MVKVSLERVKTLVLVFLFLMNLILISFNVEISKKNIFDFAKDKEMISLEVMIQNTIKPDSSYIHFGGGNNTVLKDDMDTYWNQSIMAIKAPISQSNALNEIQISDYELKKEIKSIQFNFSKDIDSQILIKSMGVEKTILSKIKGIREILIPFVDDRRIYFLASNERVYSIENPYYSELDFVSSQIADLEKTSYKRYYPIDSFFSDLTNKTLVAVDQEQVVPYYRSENILKLEEEETIKSLAKTFFGDKFDFANRIVESGGANTFIYGYGSKVLRLDPYGNIDFMNEQIKAEDTDTVKGMYKALGLIRKIGIKNIYLREQRDVKIKNKKAQYYGFSYKIDNYNLLSKGVKNEIEIIVLGDEIYSYKSILRTKDSIIPRDINLKTILSFEEIILSRNVEFFSTTQGYLGFEEDEISRKILENIKKMELLYFMDESKILLPSWYLEIGNIFYVFDAYTGETLDYGLVED